MLISRTKTENRFLYFQKPKMRFWTKASPSAIFNAGNSYVRLCCPCCVRKCRSNTPFTRYSRLSNRLYNYRFDSRLYRVSKHPTGCQTVVKPVNRVERTVADRSTRLTGLTTVWQPVGCLLTRYSRLSNRLYNYRFDNRLYRVNGVLERHLRTQHGQHSLT